MSSIPWDNGHHTWSKDNVHNEGGKQGRKTLYHFLPHDSILGAGFRVSRSSSSCSRTGPAIACFTWPGKFQKGYLKLLLYFTLYLPSSCHLSNCLLTFIPSYNLRSTKSPRRIPNFLHFAPNFSSCMMTKLEFPTTNLIMLPSCLNLSVASSPAGQFEGSPQCNTEG